MRELALAARGRRDSRNLGTAPYREEIYIFAKMFPDKLISVDLECVAFQAARLSEEQAAADKKGKRRKVESSAT